MRRKDKLVTDLKLIHKVIHKAKVMRLGLVDGLEPYVVPLSFGFDGMSIYFHSAAEGRKIDILKANNRVCLEFDQDAALVKKTDKPCGWTLRYLSVICTGKAELMTELEEKIYGLNQIIRHYEPETELYSFTEQQLSSILIFKIIPEEIVGKMSGNTL